MPGWCLISIKPQAQIVKYLFCRLDIWAPLRCLRASEEKAVYRKLETAFGDFAWRRRSWKTS